MRIMYCADCGKDTPHIIERDENNVELQVCDTCGLFGIDPCPDFDLDDTDDTWLDEGPEGEIFFSECAKGWKNADDDPLGFYANSSACSKQDCCIFCADCAFDGSREKK